MDRDQGRESYQNHSYVLSSGVHTSHRSFISSPMINDLGYEEVQKSKIQNLPNYKKNNLGDNLQFIVVFQTIEIQRLSSEVEVLRVKIKESERQLFNAQNYEVQIRELTEKCFALERQREQYREQIDKLGKICETLYHENQTVKNKLQDEDFSLKQKFQSQQQKNSDLMHQIQKWKDRYRAAEKSKAKQLQQLRNLMECQRKSMIDREIREIKIRFQNERSGLENQIRKNRQMLENRNREVQDFRQKCQRYEITIMQLKNYQNVITDNQNKIIVLNQELIRLNEILKQKQEEIYGYKQREFKLNQQLKEQQQWEYENKQLKTSLDHRSREIDDWKVRNSRLEDQANRSREMVHYNEELTHKLQVSTKQIDRLNNFLRSKLDEIEQWKKRLSEKQIQLSRSRELENDLSNYESKYSMLEAENDRINKIMKSRQEEIEEWKSKCHGLQQTIDNFSEVERAKKKLEGQFNKQIKQNQELQFLLKKMENDVNGYRQYEQQSRELEKRNAGLGKQIQRLNNIIRSNSHEVEDYRTRMNRMESNLNEYKNTELKIKEFQNKIAMLIQQNDRLNQLIRAKNQDIETLEREKIQIHTQMMRYKNYEHKIAQSQQAANRLNHQLAECKRENDRWQQKLKNSEIRSRELENNLLVNTQEKDKFSNLLKIKNNEFDDLRGKHTRLQGNMRKAAELQLVCQQQGNQIVGYVEDIEKLDKSIKEYEQELNKERQISTELGYKVIVLSCQIERITGSGENGVGGIKSREFQELQENYSILQRKIVSKNNEIDILLTKVSSLESQLGNLNNEFKRLLMEVQNSEKDTVGLMQKIDEYQDYARRIHILGAEIDRLREEKQACDDDAKRIRLKFADGLSQEKKQQDLNFSLVLMAIEIETLRSRISQREINKDQMRKSILDPVRKI